MNSSKLFRKIGYRQRSNNTRCIIYDLKDQTNYSLPDCIIINKNSKEIEFESDYIKERTFLGTISFSVNRELLQALNELVQEI